MKKINLEEVSIKNNYMIDDFIKGVVDMEFIKYGNNYILKDSNGKIVSEEEKLKLERHELEFKDECECPVEQIKKKSKINKRLRELDTKEVSNDTIEETTSTL